MEDDNHAGPAAGRSIKLCSRATGKKGIPLCRQWLARLARVPTVYPEKSTASKWRFVRCQVTRLPVPGLLPLSCWPAETVACADNDIRHAGEAELVGRLLQLREIIVGMPVFAAAQIGRLFG